MTSHLPKREMRLLARLALQKPLSIRSNIALTPPPTGVLRTVGAEMVAASLRTLKLIWIIPAERGGHVFRA
ncbi:hypothetical protein MPLSOD_40434 [Mesorhizobium sp. SOD10]|nr:hypothetical protein MPLSOD_40434 [Mesorhizobium sp. SOD10]